MKIAWCFFKCQTPDMWGHASGACIAPNTFELDTGPVHKANAIRTTIVFFLYYFFVVSYKTHPLSFEPNKLGQNIFLDLKVVTSLTSTTCFSSVTHVHVSVTGGELCTPREWEKPRDPGESAELRHNQPSEGENTRRHLQERPIFTPSKGLWYGLG